MLIPGLSQTARTKTLLLAGTAATLTAVGAGVALSRGEPDTAPQPRPDSISTDHARSAPIPHGGGQVARTDDPAAFAVSVSEVLFAWDTTTPTPLTEYAGRLLAVADPSGEESAGLVTDLTTYLPSPESWEDLKTYETRQWIDITSYEIPDDWKSADFNGETTDLADGTTAYTVTGLRRRSGIWHGKLAQTVDEVSFTIFMTCKPTYDTCKLLRLSQLNKPLR